MAIEDETFYRSTDRYATADERRIYEAGLEREKRNMAELSAESLQWKQRAEEREAKIRHLEKMLDVAEGYVDLRSDTGSTYARRLQGDLRKLREEFEEKAGYDSEDHEVETNA